jgi:hypothetical protein
LRLARTNVETRSSNAMVDSFLNIYFVVILSGVDASRSEASTESKDL